MSGSSETKKTKVAVLGGGVGAITAAFALTSPENPAHASYEVTLYQMGWRLGGKGASGRNARVHQRIEEHGLHIWMGWYHNAFRLIRDCYSELARRPGRPLATWQDAFKPHGLVTLMDLHRADWKRWNIVFPRTPDEPGGNYPSRRGQLTMLLGILRAARAVLKGNQANGTRFLRAVFGVPSVLGLLRTGLPRMLRLLLALSTDRRSTPRQCRSAREVADKYRSRLRHVALTGEFHEDDTLRRLTEMLDLVFTVVIGLIDEGVATGQRTFNALDALELRAFLRKHGADERTLECAFLRAYYNLALAYRDGDSHDPANEDAAAGVAINIMLRGSFGYRGSFMWEMQSGMGDTIFSPYYEVLRQRGVQFKFFHKVTSLEVSDDGQSIARVQLDRQVDVHGNDYNPLIDVNGLPCWPSVPRYEQLVRGEELRAHADGGVHALEVNDSDWAPSGRVMLESGVDYDTVILGIPAMALSICEPLAQRSARWRDMLAGIETVATQAFQLWLQPSVEQLSAQPEGEAVDPNAAGERAVLGAYAQPFHTWTDFSHLAKSEDWPDAIRPQTIAYFTGTIPRALEPAARTATPAGNSDYVMGEATRWLAAHARTLWPAFASGGRELAWTQLVDPLNRRGEDRMDSQYHRANLDGTERYVQHAANTTRYRLRANESGFTNLVLAGDWTDTGICGGCVEAATMSGLQASRAVSGYPRTVIGESSGPR